MATKLKMASKITVAKTSDRVYHFVKSIPRGKVVTYGQITDNLKLETRNQRLSPRLVGWVLHQNLDLMVPCHRVVDSKGRIAPNFAFGGAHEQRKRLLAEGVKFKDEMHVDLSKSLWKI